MKKSLAPLDLNLLLTLQLLLQENSVSHTAKKLNVTPSTVSKSLNKLRLWFADPLFVKTPLGLRPTPLAQSIEPELAEWLQIGSQILAKRSDAKPKEVRLQLQMESPLQLIKMNELLQLAQQHYGDATVKISNWDYDSVDAIIRGEADLGFSGREIHPRSKESLALLPYFIDHEILFTDLPQVYLRRDHPALSQPWDLAAFLRYDHINILWEKSDTWALDEVLAEAGLNRRVTVTASSFEQSLFLAAQPDQQRLTTAPAYCRHYCQQLHPDLVTLPLPLTPPQLQLLEISFAMLWHKRNGHNPKVQWLKQTVRQLYQPLGA
ncbi:HTH-type transcriptional regulator YidZ [uncultured Ferrimonas sp.]|uniref:HTH-type transcriptional regulator YidZ n=1 Tax=uncultured Ferrimonas sp. TaxID=432640 RepID=UPI0026291E2A|nr:HTH-type transcriptional regulator YidZ [uncultured Ferrimonas sp.]